MDSRFATCREFYPFYLSEHRNATTFKYPAHSLMGDWVMYWQLLTGKIRFDDSEPRTNAPA
jgi:hypothetical protein